MYVILIGTDDDVMVVDRNADADAKSPWNVGYCGGIPLPASSSCLLAQQLCRPLCGAPLILSVAVIPHLPCC